MFMYNNTQELFKTLNLELEFNLFKDLYIKKKSTTRYIDDVFLINKCNRNDFCTQLF